VPGTESVEFGDVGEIDADSLGGRGGNEKRLDSLVKQQRIGRGPIAGSDELRTACIGCDVQ